MCSTNKLKKAPSHTYNHFQQPKTHQISIQNRTNFTITNNKQETKIDCKNKNLNTYPMQARKWLIQALKELESIIYLNIQEFLSNSSSKLQKWTRSQNPKHKNPIFFLSQKEKKQKPFSVFKNQNKKPKKQTTFLPDLRGTI